MAKNIVWVMLYLLSVSLMAQTGFMKSYDIEGTDSNNGSNMLSIFNDYLIRTGPTHSNTGFLSIGLVKTDSLGIKQWDNLFENEEGPLSAAGGIKSLGTTGFIISGEIGDLGYPWQLFFLHVNEQGDSIKLKEHGDLELTDLGTPICIFNDTLLGIASYGVNETYTNLKLLKMDTCFADVTETLLLGINGYSFNFGLSIIPTIDSTFLYINIESRNNTPQNYMAVRKIDLLGNTVWTYTLSGYTTYTNTPTQTVVLDNGNIVTRWFDEIHYAWSNDFDSNPYLICLNSQGDSIWRYNFNDDAYKKFPVAITKAANGDIIGCGYTDNPNYNYACGWLFRLSPNGELLWEREYVSYTPTVNFLVPQGIDEDANGNIIVTGGIIDAIPTGGYEWNALLLKVLPNGCFTPNCNGGAEDTLIVASTVVGMESVSKPTPVPGAIAQLAVFPNPANDRLQILLPNQRDNAQIHITNLLGSTLKTVPLPPHYNQQYFNITTHDLPNGMYLVSYTQQGLLVGRAKMVVHH